MIGAVDAVEPAGLDQLPTTAPEVMAGVLEEVSDLVTVRLSTFDTGVAVD